MDIFFSLIPHLSVCQVVWTPQTSKVYHFPIKKLKMLKVHFLTCDGNLLQSHFFQNAAMQNLDKDIEPIANGKKYPKF